MSARTYFGTDGIRGPANQHPLTPDFAVALGRAAASVLATTGDNRHPKVVIGRDTRISGPMLEAALAAGLNSAGADVELLGVLPTPGVALNCRRLGADFAAVISASHNPAADNGIKFFGADGFKLPDGTEEAIERAIETGSPGVAGDAVGIIRVVRDARDSYLEAGLNSVSGLNLKGFKVVVDAANGAASGITAEAFTRLGAEVVEVAASPDGANINLGCGCTHPSFLEAHVTAAGAHLGIAHDGDADRILVVDETGSALDGDEFMAIAARHLASKGQLPGNKLVSTIMSNFGLDACLQEVGCQLVRTDVGDRHVIEAMRANDYALGGEQSGHIIFKQFTTTGDGLVAALQIVSIVRETGLPLSELRKCLRKFPQAQAAVPVSSKPDLASVPALQAAITRTEAALGGAGRVLCRYSGTEPKLRILLEGEDATQLKLLCDGLEATIKQSIG